MSRFQLSLNVADARAAAAFYSKLFGVEPAKQRPGYANFVVDEPRMKLVLIENEGEPGTINHLGIELANGSEVADETRRIAKAGLSVEVDDPHSCCFATQEKAWTRDDDGVPWELYTVVGHTDHFGASPSGGTPIEFVAPSVDSGEIVAALADTDVLVVDAQQDAERVGGRLPGALLLQPDQVLAQIEREAPDHDHRILVYCASDACGGSENVARALVGAGYTNVGRYPGGIDELRRRGAPVEAGPLGRDGG